MLFVCICACRCNSSQCPTHSNAIDSGMTHAALGFRNPDIPESLLEVHVIHGLAGDSDLTSVLC